MCIKNITSIDIHFNCVALVCSISFAPSNRYAMQRERSKKTNNVVYTLIKTSAYKATQYRSTKNYLAQNNICDRAKNLLRLLSAS